MFLPAPSPPPYSLPSSPPPAHAPTCLPSTHSSPTPTQYPARTCKAQENTTKMNSKIQSLETEMAAIKQTSSVERQESVMIVRALEAYPPTNQKNEQDGKSCLDVTNRKKHWWQHWSRDNKQDQSTKPSEEGEPTPHSLPPDTCEVINMLGEIEDKKATFEPKFASLESQHSSAI